MEFRDVDEAVELLEKANVDLEPELLPAPVARKLLETYARAEKLAAFGVAALARKLDDASEIARVTGTSLGEAKAVISTGKTMGVSDELSAALQQGDVSLDQATEIAKAEESAPGVATELLAVADEESFHVLKEKAHKAKLEAEQHKGLATRQHAARSARSYGDELGMVHIHLALEPHVGDPDRGPGGGRSCSSGKKSQGPGGRGTLRALPRRPTPRSSQGRARVAPNDPSWWCWSATRWRSGAGPA